VNRARLSWPRRPVEIFDQPDAAEVDGPVGDLHAV
jgi:hypothetical protein